MRYGYSYRQLQRERFGDGRGSGSKFRWLIYAALLCVAAGLGYRLGGSTAEEPVLNATEGPTEEQLIAELEEAERTPVEGVSAEEMQEGAHVAPALPQVAAADPFAEEIPIEGEFYGPFPAPEMVRDHLKLQVGAGQTLTGLLDQSGIQPSEAQALLRALAAEVDVNRVPRGARMDLVVDGNKRPLEVAYEPYPLRLYGGTRDVGGWRIALREVELQIREAPVSGRVEDSLFTAVQQAGEQAELAVRLANLFAWQIDFARQTRSGDTFRLIVQKRFRDDRFWDYGDVLAAQYNNAGTLYRAFCFPVKEGERSCFDEEGRSTRRAFLRAPLDFRRISSGFSKRRYHPVLKVFRPHEGVDYAAAVGTPVWSVADGVVSYAGYKGGNGNMVIVRHPNGYLTYYNHLSRFARGIRSGVRVAQKQVIGYVGSTGLSTGPHLDYRIKYSGKFLDPLKVKLPPGDPVPTDLRGEFFAFRDFLISRLEAVDAMAKAEAGGDGSGT